MAIDYYSLPVYQQKQRILDTLSKNKVVVVQSPTGSGKTTQIPVILHEAGYSKKGIIAVTQPRRIAAVSVSSFIAKQLQSSFPCPVGYKMRFEDKTDASTRIKIMTDGILLQEMKLDPWMSKYSVIMVDEAHERSLNIDFVLGLLKRILSERSDFKVLISSATMNAEAFSTYFDGCPIVTIDTVTFPITTIYDPPVIATNTQSQAAEDALLLKIEDIIARTLESDGAGDILVFLSGERIIKDCVQRLSTSPLHKDINIIPLYGRLPKEEQERVFDPAPPHKKKVVLSTNIAETSVTIDGITTVIDSGLVKLNFYNPHTFTSSLLETPVSKASCNQRRGRSGRTGPGTCYRLYAREDFEERKTYTLEEIYRTDLSEVVLRMAELGITDFEKFDFISPPDNEGLIGAVDTLKQLNALDNDRTLSKTGRLMVQFPLEPRISRIIVEAILHYPAALQQVLIAASFLSAQSPFILPSGEELDARKAHHSFGDERGDFVTYLKLYNAYTTQKNRSRFCQKNYIDERVMAEIENINFQLTQIVSDMQIPIGKAGPLDDYLCCVATGMIQFVCIRDGVETYKTLTAEHITIHPGSCMFRRSPRYVVAGEIVRTSRMFAMSVSPLTTELLSRIEPDLEQKFESCKKGKGAKLDERKGKNSDTIFIGRESFEIKKIKGKKTVMLPWESFKRAIKKENDRNKLDIIAGLRGCVQINSFELLCGEKMDVIMRAAKTLSLEPVDEKSWNRKLNIRIGDTGGVDALVSALGFVMRVAFVKSKNKGLGFICLLTNGAGVYWMKVSKSFSIAVHESLASLESLVDEQVISLSSAQKAKINFLYRMLRSLYND